MPNLGISRHPHYYTAKSRVRKKGGKWSALTLKDKLWWLEKYETLQRDGIDSSLPSVATLQKNAC